MVFTCLETLFDDDYEWKHHKKSVSGGRKGKHPLYFLHTFTLFHPRAKWRKEWINWNCLAVKRFFLSFFFFPWFQLFSPEFVIEYDSKRFQAYIVLHTPNVWIETTLRKKERMCVCVSAYEDENRKTWCRIRDKGMQGKTSHFCCVFCFVCLFPLVFCVLVRDA